MRESTEPFSVSDNSGRYVIHDIRPPAAAPTGFARSSWGADRAHVPVASDWQCSYPNDATPGGTGSATNGRFQCGWGPFNSDSEPTRTGLRQLVPRSAHRGETTVPVHRPRPFRPGSPSRYDPPVISVPAAGDRRFGAASVPPGTYTVSESAAVGTDAAAYRSWVWCRGARLLGRPVVGTSASVALSAGQAVKCTFYNVRPGTPAIAIAKSGPDVATAGDTLQYRLVVTNPGEVPFPASAVEVTDEQCTPQAAGAGVEG